MHAAIIVVNLQMCGDLNAINKNNEINSLATQLGLNGFKENIPETLDFTRNLAVKIEFNKEKQKRKTLV